MGTSLRNTWKSIDTYEAKKYHFFKSKDDLQKEKQKYNHVYDILTPLTHVNLKNRINEYEALKNDFSVFKLKIAT